ncbi:hypothetical protein C7401_14343 [Paraburkholderia unamae]|uniref:hypothetical protein n=1 Tax=Paraburkholderia unamae TaxID=219649 RepID=UPI000DC23F8B|nr:hypothetical protein [Paraburkholderia unamae]RAR50051.1 hypothetical protein C7401_14343 [Paraburkholderia unamae]
MKNIVFPTLIMTFCNLAYGVPPDESLVKSCLLARAYVPSVTVLTLNPHEISQEDNYADGFNATYIFKYNGVDVGYAESKSNHALIYLNRIYKISTALPVGDNHKIKPSEFDPTLAQWSIAKKNREKFFCVRFNFDGLGQSGNFQNVVGGYLINTRTKEIFFAVRKVK